MTWEMRTWQSGFKNGSKKMQEWFKKWFKLVQKLFKWFKMVQKRFKMVQKWFKKTPGNVPRAVPSFVLSHQVLLVGVC